MSKETKTKIILEHGEAIVVRPIARKDAQARHEFFVHLSMAQDGIVHTVDETELHTQETEDHVHDFLNYRRGLWLIAKNADCKVVGEIDITIKHLTRIRHNGNLTIGIVPEYQGQGLGTFLMEQALTWANAHGLLRIEISVFANNLRAIALYKKFGFIVEGMRKNFLRREHGFEDDYVMAKYL